jgi:5-methylcytosine-specific restriction endonuclease McrA
MSLIKGTKQKVVCAHCNTSFIKKTSGMISKSGLHFCTRACKDEAQKYMTEIQPDHYGSSKAYRTKALEFYGPVCNRCGYNDNVAALVVHHIDRDRDNNELANLEVLCSNCHAIEHYGGSR